jgi:Ca2+/H+ antiporter
VKHVYLIHRFVSSLVRFSPLFVMDAFWIGSSTAKFVNWPATVKFVISFLSIIPLAAVSRCVADAVCLDIR